MPTTRPTSAPPRSQFVDYQKKKVSVFSEAKGVLVGAQDTALNKAVDSVLDALDDSVLVVDPYQPKCLVKTGQAITRATWEEVKQSLQGTVVESASWKDMAYRKRRLRHWAGAPKCSLNLYTWVRAKFLYAINPADGTFFKVMRDPVAVAFFLLTMCPVYALQVWAFVLLFIFIDKRDEYQLVWFILKFKMTQAVSMGTTLLVTFAIFAYHCLYEIAYEDTYPELVKNGTLDSLGQAHLGHDWCRANAPGSSAWLGGRLQLAA